MRRNGTATTRAAASQRTRREVNGLSRFRQGPVSRLAVGPHFVLATAVLMTLGLEALRGRTTVGFSIVWPVAQAAVVGCALLFAWRRQNELRLPLVLGLGLVLELGWIGVHLARGVPAEYDVAFPYRSEGNALLHGSYPASEYPPGAVLIFAFDTLIGGGSTHHSHPFVMVPFEILLVVAIWCLRTAWSPWFATVVAVWPMNAFFWETKFDLVPAAFLVLGLGLAFQERWLLSGVALGLGAAVKWTPALSLAALVLWLIRSRGGRTAGAHLGGAVCAFLVVNVPFLVWSPHQVFAAYRLQGSRGITGESLPFIPLKLLGFARSSNEFWNAAAVPNHANGVAIAVQAVVVLASFIVVATRGRNLAAAVATAAMVPVVFLLFNRIFSPQFLVPLAAAWAVAGSLLARNRRDQLLLGILICGATLANTLVYPTRPSAWLLFSGTLFVLSLLATGFVYVMARASHAGGPRSDPRCAHS